jgi:hypothetical protein
VLALLSDAAGLLPGRDAGAGLRRPVTAAVLCRKERAPHLQAVISAVRAIWEENQVVQPLQLQARRQSGGEAAAAERLMWRQGGLLHPTFSTGL